jgi:ABC-type xylose transport system permease subunit
MAAGTLLAGAVVLGLRARDEPRLRWAFWCAALVAALPWLGVQFAGPGAVIAVALAVWLRRRQRGLAAFVALEVILTSAVVYVTVNDRLFGGPTPHAARLPGDSPTGATSVHDHLERAGRLLGLWLDRDAGLLRWAPIVALAGFAAWLLWRSRRERVALAVPERADAEVAAGLLLVTVAAVGAIAVFAAPALHGSWLVPPAVWPAFPAVAALAAWGLRHAPRVGTALAVLTLVASIWLLVAGRLDHAAGVAPPSGALPWGGAERVLPRFPT